MPELDPEPEPEPDPEPETEPDSVFFFFSLLIMRHDSSIRSAENKHNIVLADSEAT